MPYADVNGQHIRYEDTGTDLPVVLCSHGFLMNHTMFDHQVDALEQEFRVVRWDERGFGDTPATEAFTYWDSANDAIALLDHLGIDQAVFAGMSQGGYLSLRAALAHPERVRALVLMNTCHDMDNAETHAGNQQLLEAWEAGAYDEVAPMIAQIILGPEEHWEPWISLWKSIDMAGFKHASACLLGKDDIEGRIGEINAPALVVHGTEDSAIHIDRARSMASALKDCRGMVEVQGAAHAANLTHPAEVNPPVLEFLRGL
ncbi:MAG: alpha/beta hydrolase [Pseudomonadota bacterium]